jgi:aerobic carbon-monoxide dehydrogenase medium subunit
VKPAPFGFARARSLEQVFDLLEQHGAEARLLAGGQSLLASLNMRLSAPEMLLAINHVHGLDGIAQANGRISIGALARFSAVERSAEIASKAPLVAAAVPHIAHLAVRNRGTVGGSIAFADPAAELPACAVALDAEIEVAGRGGSRRIAAADFFKDLYETDLRPGEMVTALHVPAAKSSQRFGFAEIARRHGDYALIGLAARAEAEDGRLGDARLVFFSAGPVPVRARGAEAALAEGNLDDAVAALAEDLDPPGDPETSSGTRRYLAGVLLRRVAADLQGEKP